MGFSSFLAWLAISFAAQCHARGAMKQMEAIEQGKVAVSGWTEAGRAAATLAKQEITLQVGLTLQHTDKLYTELLARSDPKSSKYGQWLDRDEANALIKPSSNADRAVRNWLREEGIVKVHSDGTWVTFVTTVEKANQLLNANFRQYSRDGISKVRTMRYSVPEEVVSHIDLIHPTTFFGKTEPFTPVHVPRENPTRTTNVRRQGTTTEAPSCATSVSPQCLKEFYNIGNYTPSAKSGSRIGFGSFLNQTAQYKDLAMFEEYFGIPPQNFTKVFVNDAPNPQDTEDAIENAGEANLDLQIMIGVANPLPVTEFLTGGSPPFVPDMDMPTAANNTNEPYVPYYQYLLTKKNSELPQVISNSYGEPEQTIPWRYAQRTCTMIAVMGIRGVTVLESSGDVGIGSYCRSNDGSNRLRFLPQFPSTCPWITSVGGTESAYPEIAWRDSSGGFSDYFARPSYQEGPIATFYKKYFPKDVRAYFEPYFNPGGRGFPDISAHSLLPYFQIVYGLRMARSGGTSASAPVIGSIVGLLNDARLKAGLPTMGFINPWLYSNWDKFLVDVTQGFARGCDGVNHQTGKNYTNGGIIPGALWNATVGWDPVTGLGIPDFQKMLSDALAIANKGKKGQKGQHGQKGRFSHPDDDEDEDENTPWWLGRSRYSRPSYGFSRGNGFGGYRDSYRSSRGRSFGFGRGY